MKIVRFLYSPIYQCGFPLPLCGFPLPSGVIGGSSGSAKDVRIVPETKVRATKQISTRDAIFTNDHLLKTSFMEIMLFYKHLSKLL
jgi:hypothetical protein